MKMLFPPTPRSTLSRKSFRTSLANDVIVIVSLAADTLEEELHFPALKSPKAKIHFGGKNRPEQIFSTKDGYELTE